MNIPMVFAGKVGVLYFFFEAVFTRKENFVFECRGSLKIVVKLLSFL